MTQVRVLSTKAVVLTGVALLVIGVGLAIWFVLAYGGPDNQLEAIKTAGTFVVGGGGAAALYLTARRQRSNEMALQQKELDQQQADRTYALQERVAAATEAESQQRRITDSYGAALEQLGSDKPAVRLGSLYALERLAQDNPAQRQMIVNVICAYLRMAPETPSTQETEVRKTAQHILATHLRRADAERFWPDMDLDLSGAVVRSFDFGDCVLRTGDFEGVEFQETTRFSGLVVTGHADFRRARFAGPCRFVEAKFSTAAFSHCRFDQSPMFDGAAFTGDAWFDHAEFVRGARFADARFADVSFSEGAFSGDARFSRAEFTRSADFRQAWFAEPPSFNSPRFANQPDFTGVLVRGVEVDHGWPEGWHCGPLDPADQVPGGDRSAWRKMVRRT